MVALLIIFVPTRVIVIILLASNVTVEEANVPTVRINPCRVVARFAGV
jgi:hypothetical protein